MSREVHVRFREGAGVRVPRATRLLITGRTAERLATEGKPVVEHFLRERGLELSSTKTRIAHISEGFDVLGQRIRKYDGKFLTRPSPKRVRALLGTVRERLTAHPQAKAGDMILQRNPLLRGWANDHRHGASAHTFGSNSRRSTKPSNHRDILVAFS
jgi:RNA-directed DNA polymerase